MPATTIAITNHKGGVGKTTTAVNLAAGLAAFHAKRVLLIDFDPQSHATLAVGHEVGEGQETPISQLLGARAAPTQTAENPAPGPQITDCVVATRIENLFLIPGDKELPVKLPAHRFGVLSRVLEPLLPRLDFVLIDTPPGLNVITTNALFAADWALVPCQQAIFSFEGLADLLEVIDEIAAVRQGVDPAQFYRILLTMVDARLKRSSAYAETELAEYRDRLCRTRIRRNDALNQAQAARLSIFHFDNATAGADDYRELIEEVLAYEPKTTTQPVSQ